MEVQKVHNTFCCSLLTSSDILHSGYRGTGGCLRFNKTFYAGAYDYVENDVCEHNCIIDKDGWQKYCSGKDL